MQQQTGTKLTKDAPIADIRRAVAEAVKLPCPNVRHEADGLPRTDDVCPECTESGQVYPLRVPCPGIPDHPGLPNIHPQTDHPPTCRCHGREGHWTPITDPDAYTQAIRAMGWILCSRCDSQRDGDWYFIQRRKEERAEIEYIAGCESRYGLRDSHAVLVAFARALGVME